MIYFNKTINNQAILLIYKLINNMQKKRTKI